MHVYLLHPPGGVVGGDTLDINIDCEANAKALITTPAAQKLYRSAGAQCRLKTVISLSPGAQLDWLPAETIIFDGAIVESALRVNLASDAQFIGWEMACFGRPASAIAYNHGHYSVRVELYRQSLPILIERSGVTGGSKLLQEPWGFAGYPAFGALYCVFADSAKLEKLTQELREQIPLTPTARIAATLLDEIVVLRVHATCLQHVRSTLITAWHIARPIILGRLAHAPRIWST